MSNNEFIVNEFETELEKIATEAQECDTENEEIFRRVAIEENIYNSRGCAHAPNLQESSEDRCCQMSCCAQMHSYPWGESISNLPSPDPFDIVEIRFKNTHKDFFRLPEEGAQEYQCGDIVAVEGNPGHDIGIICLKGELVRLQLRNKGIDPTSLQIKKVYRKAKQCDVDKWNETINLEKETQRRARIIAAELGLGMKINNVEYQGDFTKAIFYYTADDRVDFRQLIKRYAEEFHVRVEMKQIGARQEAGLIGGVGSCGRELCCVTFLHNFSSVSTHAARVQQVSLNPQKLAGQCSKLKCCLNFEYDTYNDIQKSLPDSHTTLETEKGLAHCIKTDILRRKLTFVYDFEPNKYYELDADIVTDIIEANTRGEKPADLPLYHSSSNNIESNETIEFSNVVGQDDLTRFDKSSKGTKENRKRKKGNHNEDRKKAGDQRKNDTDFKEKGRKNRPKQFQKPVGSPIPKDKNDIANEGK